MRAQATDGSIVSAYVREAVRRAEEERPGRLLLSLWLTAEPAHTITCKKSSGRIALLQSDGSSLAIQPSGFHAELLKPESISAASNQLRRFVDCTKIPWVESQMGKGVIDARAPPPAQLCICQGSASGNWHACTAALLM